jgi:acyl-coenzyme A thioesterase PaaI-like protein
MSPAASFSGPGAYHGVVTHVPPAVTPSEVEHLVRSTMPEVGELPFAVEELVRGRARLRIGFDPRRLRPGGTLSGPTVMLLADLALYGMTLSVVGMEPLAVTTDLTLHFVRKPPPADLIAEATLIKAGKRLVVGSCLVWSADGDDPVAHAVGTYSVPPRG